MTYKPKVSVCIVTYNQERYIKDCLLSVVGQSYDADLEILVGDDASTDSTPLIIQDISSKYPGIITLFHHKMNLGPSANYLFLIERAKGDYIAHLDGDDYWMQGKLETQVAFLEKHPECIAVYANAVLIDETKDILGAFNRPQPEVFDLDYLIEDGNFLNHSSLLYRKSARTLILDITPPFVDYRIHLRFAAVGKLGFMNQMLVAYRVGAVGSMSENANCAVNRGITDAISEVLQKRLAGKAAVRTMLLNWYVCAWSVALLTGKVGKAINMVRWLNALFPELAVLLIVLALPTTIFRYGRIRAQRICKHIAGCSKFYVHTSK